MALVFVNLLLPIFNQITFKEFNVGSILQGKFIFGLVLITIITGIISGSYPALFLSAFQPVKVLKGQLSTGRSQILRKILVIFQFTLSIVLIIGTIVIYQQLNLLGQVIDIIRFKEQPATVGNLFGDAPDVAAYHRLAMSEALWDSHRTVVIPAGRDNSEEASLYRIAECCSAQAAYELHIIQS